MNTRKSGVAALLVVVVLGATALLMTLGATFLGLGEIDQAFTLSLGARARSVAEGCAEYALEQLRENPAYTGGDLPTFTDGSCTVSVNLDGPFHVIISRGRHGMYYNTLNVRVDLSGGTVQLVELSE
ncbi:MAG: hypothetical protein A3J04_00185 [Candidatus Ryanbacteria bacterium RIFCSPLOWO2_02_FULL_47_14]|uniref:Uncharacterized protein n=1 Tax=Candidatus Ryanbacteria bacterium RIFCSPLOWO2_02_FULL_47_14 TaxID=1802129 RepID=A0A1G2H3D9_9BACT|nr:MAG: hypothetical protein A3J04_00185 [Candidatus Ryanbacteria bacterium RIFCSPLOWO2_02_FULL_47_14]